MPVNPSDISSSLIKLGVSLNVVSILTTVIYIILYLAMKQTFTDKPNVKWSFLGTVIAINIGNLITNIKDAINASANNESVSLPISMASLSTIGGVIAPILLTTLNK